MVHIDVQLYHNYLQELFKFVTNHITILNHIETMASVPQDIETTPQVVKSVDYIPQKESQYATAKRSNDVEIDEALAHEAMNPTMMECFQHCKFLLYSLYVAAFGGILFGYDTGMNTLIFSLHFIHLFYAL
jgi:hypothetical protein